MCAGGPAAVSVCTVYEDVAHVLIRACDGSVSRTVSPLCASVRGTGCLYLVFSFGRTRNAEKPERSRRVAPRPAPCRMRWLRCAARSRGSAQPHRMHHTAPGAADFINLILSRMFFRGTHRRRDCRLETEKNHTVCTRTAWFAAPMLPVPPAAPRPSNMHVLARLAHPAAVGL
jgi:hypothetical protein